MTYIFRRLEITEQANLKEILSVEFNFQLLKRRMWKRKGNLLSGRRGEMEERVNNVEKLDVQHQLTFIFTVTNMYVELQNVNFCYSK